MATNSQPAAPFVPNTNTSNQSGAGGHFEDGMWIPDSSAASPGAGGASPGVPSPSAPISTPQGAVEAQANAGTQLVNQQTQANRPDINTPFGFQKWVQGPDGEWSLETGLSPQVQAAYEGLQPFSFGQFGQLGTGDTARNQAIEAAYNQATSRLNPMFQQRESQLRSQLANQGLDPNSEAARGALAQLNSARNDAFGSAMNAAIGQGQTAGDAVFRNNMLARQQAISEALQQRGMPLADLAGLQPFMQMPSFMGAGVAQAPQYLNALMAQLSLDQQGQADQAEIINTLLRAAGTAAPLIMASDERLKQNIKRQEVDTLPGVPWAFFEYKDRPEITYIGVIAQDLEKVRPDLVIAGADGIKAVNYTGLFQAMRDRELEVSDG